MTATRTRPAGALRRAIVLTSLLLAVAAAAGCRASWTPQALVPPAPLQWPYAPAAARVTYSHAIAGLSRDADAGSVLRSVVLGTSERDGGFLLPVAMARGPGGSLAVADAGCACVHLYIPGDSSYRRLNGSGQARLRSPVGVAFAEDRLFVSDSTGALFAFGLDGTFVFARHEAGGEPWLRPTGLAWNPDRRVLYVVDTLAHAVRVLDVDGTRKGSLGSRGSGPGQLNFPTHVAIAPDGNVFVTDAMNFRIAMFDAEGKPAGSFGRHGDGSGDIAMPKGIAVDGNGVVYVVDALFDNVQLFDRDGRFLLTVGSRGKGFGEFWLPSGAFLDQQGSFHVCDTYNGRIQVFRVENGHASRSS